MTTSIASHHLKKYLTIAGLLFYLPSIASSNDWQWEIKLIDYYQSHIVITEGHQAIAQYEIACRPDENPPEQILERQAYIKKLTPPRSSNPVLLARCHVGAHSQTVYAFDPYRNSKEPVIEVTGSYYASWENTKNTLWIIYDRECTSTQNKPCEMRFEEARIEWPTQ